MGEHKIPESENQCPECQQWGAGQGFLERHDALCTQQPVEDQLRKCRDQLKALRDYDATRKTMYRRLKELVTFWQGKFHIVRHENNKLRKKWHHLIAISDPETLEAHQRILHWLGCPACKAAAEAEIKATVEGKRIVKE